MRVRNRLETLSYRVDCRLIPLEVEAKPVRPPLFD